MIVAEQIDRFIAGLVPQFLGQTSAITAPIGRGNEKHKESSGLTSGRCDSLDGPLAECKIFRLNPPVCLGKHCFVAQPEMVDSIRYDLEKRRPDWAEPRSRRSCRNLGRRPADAAGQRPGPVQLWGGRSGCEGPATSNPSRSSSLPHSHQRLMVGHNQAGRSLRHLVARNDAGC